MANNELKAIVSADVSLFNKAMNDIGLQTVGASATAVAAIGAITASIIALEKAAISAAAADQELERRLQFILRDAEKGSKAFQDIREEAAKSVLETDALTKAYILLQAQLGEKLDIDDTVAIGFAARGAGKNFQDAALAVAKLYRRLEQGRRVDVDLLDRLSGIFPTEFIERLRQGGVEVDDLKKELDDAGKAGEKAFKGTLGSAVAVLQGSIKLLLSTLGGGENLDTFTQSLETISKVLDDLRGSEEIRMLNQSFAELFQILGEAFTPEEVTKGLKDILWLISGLVDLLKELLDIYTKVKGFEDFLNPLAAFAKLPLRGAQKLGEAIGPQASSLAAPTAREREEFALRNKELKLSIKTKEPQVKNKTWGE
jgi:hypothetical protein